MALRAAEPANAKTRGSHRRVLKSEHLLSRDPREWESPSSKLFHPGTRRERMPGIRERERGQVGECGSGIETRGLRATDGALLREPA